MIKTLTAVEDGLALVIDKPILDLLNIDTTTPLEVLTDGKGLIIRPAGRHERPAEAASLPPQNAETTPPPAMSSADAVPPPPPASSSLAAPPPPPENHLEQGPPEEDLFAEEEGEDNAEVAEEAELFAEEALPPEPEPTPVPAPPAEPDGEPEVVVELRGEEVLRVPLCEENMVIGRDPNVHLHLDDLALSRKHASIERRGAAIWVIDLKSANGTFVNGERIEAHRLHADDIIGVGRYRVRLANVAEAQTNTPVLTLSGPEGDHRFLLVGEQIIVGRSQRCDITIGHSGISRRHVRIEKTPKGFLVEDLGSPNPARLNGEVLEQPMPFAEGDVLEICEFRLELGFLSEPAPADDASGIKTRHMVIDRSLGSQAAYMEGDFENLRAHAAPEAEKPLPTTEYRAGGYGVGSRRAAQQRGAGLRGAQPLPNRPKN